MDYKMDVEKTLEAVFYILRMADIAHVSKYGRPITGYLSESDMECIDTAYRDKIIAEIKVLPNIEEILEYIKRV